MSPRVSIVILSYNHPEIIDKCLTTLMITEGVDHEVVVVDNGSDDITQDYLRAARDHKLIDTLVLNGYNALFSEGNNIGVAHSNPESEFILLLNSDVAFLRPDWLTKLMAWLEGVPDYKPCVWDAHPTVPSPGPRDIVSYGWSHDAAVQPGRVRPEGWCCLFRRSVWRDMDPNFPWHYGFEKAIAESVRAGAKVGVLFNYSSYVVHREGGSGEGPKAFDMPAAPDLPGWYNGLNIESLDFTLGPFEHDSYIVW